MDSKVWTVEEVRENVISRQVWTEHGVLAIYKRQTSSEQSAEQTVEHNGVGFNGVDAPIMSSFAKWLLSGRHLTPKQLAVAQKKICKYAAQLTEIANARG